MFNFMTTPWWLQLLIALVGGVTAALATGALTAKREETRWERERRDRLEQWQREDRARWHDERKASFAVALLAIDHWVAAIHDPFNKDKMQQGSDGVNAAKLLTSIELVIPAVDLPTLRAIREGVVYSAGYLTLESFMERRPTGDPSMPLVYHGSEVLASRLRDLMRRTLAIDPGEEYPSEETKRLEAFVRDRVNLVRERRPANPTDAQDQEWKRFEELVKMIRVESPEADN